MSAPAPQSRLGLLAPTLPSPPTSIPWLGLVAVLLGTFISTLNRRLSTFGLADIRGAVGAGFDEGAWITTAQTAAQMFVTVIAVWMGAAYGPRRVLIWASHRVCRDFASHPVLGELTDAPDAAVSSAGLASGFFIPLTLSFILLNMPPRYWAFGIAIYALNLELSLNISASLEGWYVEHHSWRWIFWQNVPLALLMSLCLRQGIAIKPITVQATVRPIWSCDGRRRARIDLCGARSGQSARLAELGTGVGTARRRRSAPRRLLRARSRTAHPLLDLKVVFGAPLLACFC